MAVVRPEVAHKVAAHHLAAVHPAAALAPVAAAAYLVLALAHLVADRKAVAPDAGVSSAARLMDLEMAFVD